MHTNGVNQDIALFDAIDELAEPDAASVIASISHHDQHFLPMFPLFDIVESGIQSVVKGGASLSVQTDGGICKLAAIRREFRYDLGSIVKCHDEHLIILRTLIEDVDRRLVNLFHHAFHAGAAVE